ncbi:MAG: GNAT family N-acetyltransferase [Flavobacteriaceae bacterium]|jgi:RimJ/RimL family protein N-acetyltransferase|nr:GNAT family N-acetyltransferase [Flavobacteriaceae bacterium]
MEIKDFGIVLRLAEIEDAGFILELRNDLKKSRFISVTSGDLSVQVEWLEKYKQREKRKEEFYFIALDEDGNKFATYRVYNIGPDTVEIGSWISSPSLKNPINSIKVDFLVKRFIFDTLNYKKLNFEVRKKNKSVINYHKKYNPQIIKQDDLNIYFELTKESFQETKNRFEKLFQ